MHPRCQLLSGRLSTTGPGAGAVARSAQSTQRAYATSSPAPPVKNPLQRRRGGDLGSHLPKYVIPKDAYIPPYPYGDHQLFKQANKGLYGEQKIQFGNNVSEETETKTRRNWKPNILSKSLYSVALKKKIKLRITSKVLKTMDREGGLDEYLLKDNEHRIKELGPMGWALRWTLMQKPEVIKRLRAEAAALGIDPATIDKQWPTHAMMSQQKALRAASSESVPADWRGHQAFNETAEQEMWEPDQEDEEGPLTEPTLSKLEKNTAFKAGTEYTKATKAAQRYLKRGLVDSEEEGLKLAFVRAKEREEAALSLSQNFELKLKQMFTVEDLQAIRTKFSLPNISDRTARKIAYNQWKRQQIDNAGGLKAWQEAQNAEILASRTAAGDAYVQPLSQADKKAMYADLIAEAETASTNQSLHEERRLFLETAISKADRAIRAKVSGGRDEYVELTLEELRRDSSTPLGELYQASIQGRGAGEDAWGSLVKSSNSPPQSQTQV